MQTASAVEHIFDEGICNVQEVAHEKRKDTGQLSLR
jgi:hypothetical protein